MTGDMLLIRLSDMIIQTGVARSSTLPLGQLPLGQSKVGTKWNILNVSFTRNGNKTFVRRKH